MHITFCFINHIKTGHSTLINLISIYCNQPTSFDQVLFFFGWFLFKKKSFDIILWQKKIYKRNPFNPTPYYPITDGWRVFTEVRGEMNVEQAISVMEKEKTFKKDLNCFFSLSCSARGQMYLWFMVLTLKCECKIIF